MAVEAHPDFASLIRATLAEGCYHKIAGYDRRRLALSVELHIMKVFWSWQSDTPGRIGRHFVRETLEEAINELKQAPEVEEPTARERREDLHLDHDRKGVSGSPDLARMIFDKIELATVFIADVTPVGQTFDGAKKLINSNVAIEYGHAHKSLGDTAILMVHNQHYGSREDLPFDLKHKAGPIQYTLAPNASKQEIEAEKAKLKGQFVTALRPYLAKAPIPLTTKFPEIAAASSPAVFFEASEVLAVIGMGTEDEIEYRFNEPRAFYLRVIPTQLREPLLKNTELFDLVNSRELDALSRVRYSSFPDRNRFGAITYEPSGTSTTPRSFSQAFRNGELWGVTTEFFVYRENNFIIPTVNVENIYKRVLRNYCEVTNNIFGIDPPYQVVCGAVGMRGAYLALQNRSYAGPIHDDKIELRIALNDIRTESQEKLIGQFLTELFDLAGEKR